MEGEMPLWEQKKELGNASFKAANFVDAINHYTCAIEENNREAALFSNRAAAHLKLSKFASAAQDAETAIAIDPTFVKAYSRLHTALCNLGRFSDAARAMQRGVECVSGSSGAGDELRQLSALQRQAEEASASLEVARRCIQENNLQKAESALVTTYRNFPDCPLIAFTFAEARAPREPDEVSVSMQAFAGTHESDPQYLYVRALCTYYRGQEGFATAGKILRAALEYDPDNANARILMKKIRAVEQHKELGNNAFKEKRFADAQKHYGDAIDVDGSNRRMNATLRGNRAAARLELKDYQGALLDCEFAIKNGNDAPKMLARRSRIYEALEKMDDALRDLQHAAERDDHYANDLRQLKIRVKRSKRKDYYKILGLDQQTATEESIKRAYKKGALQWHPDKWGHSSEEEKSIAEAKFKEVGEAFAVLSDPRKKQMYDNGQLDDNVEGSGAGGGGFGGQEDMMNMFNMMFAGGFPGGAGGFPGGGGRGRRGTPQGFPPGFSFSFQ